MKRKLLRLSIVLICLTLALYFFLRGPGIFWTASAKHISVLGFAPDGQSVWTYHWDEKQDPVTVTLQRHAVVSGEVLQEHRVDLGLTNLDLVNQGQRLYIRPTDDGKMAYLNVPQVSRAKFTPLNWIIDLATGTVQKLPILGNDVGYATYSLSPTGRWISLHNGKGRIIQDRHTLQTVFSLPNEVPGDAPYCCPEEITFSSDETRIAVPWSHRNEKGETLSSELRFYETLTWKELSRQTVPQAESIGISRWQGNELWCYFINQGDPTRYERFFSLIRSATAVSDPRPALLEVKLIHEGHVRSNVREWSLLMEQGHDWYVVRNFRETIQHPWVESLRSKPVLSQIINVIVPRETLNLEFYRMSSLQLMNRLSVRAQCKYCVSPDGQWIAGDLFQPGQICVCSSSAAIRWPGYLLLMSMAVVLFWRRPIPPSAA